jgi:hypothetical protein
MLTGVTLVLPDIFREHWPAFRDSRRWPRRVYKAGAALSGCRTSALGGHLERCPHGHFERRHYNSCRHRSCPLCAWRDRARWVAAQIQRLPACDYFHVIFTIPSEYRPLWRYNRAAFTNLLMRAGWETLRQMLADPKHLGALPGAVAGFHSWGQTLWVHPHAHFLVSAGGLDPQGRWRPCPYSGLLPARALSAKFRGKLRAWLIREIKEERLVLPPERTKQQWLNELNRLGRKRHNVRVMPRYRHGRGVIAYLGRYLKGGCVSDRRLTRLANGSVRLAYKDNHCNPPKSQSLELSVEELMTRVLEHVPETGQHVVRSYGLFAPARREELDVLRAHLGELPPEAEDEVLAPLMDALDWEPPARICPVCGATLISTPLPRIIRPPPSGACAA